MYPHVTQFETRQQELDRELDSMRESARAERHSTRPRTPGAFPRHKLALLTWAGAYALITLILALLGPAMAAWPLPLRTFVLSVTMVAGLTCLVMPRLTRL